MKYVIVYFLVQNLVEIIKLMMYQLMYEEFVDVDLPEESKEKFNRMKNLCFFSQ